MTDLELADQWPKPWRFRSSNGWKAIFVHQPRGPLQKLALWLRGYRHTHYYWWTRTYPRPPAMPKEK